MLQPVTKLGRSNNNASTMPVAATEDAAHPAKTPTQHTHCCTRLLHFPARMAVESAPTMHFCIGLSLLRPPRIEIGTSSLFAFERLQDLPYITVPIACVTAP